MPRSPTPRARARLSREVLRALWSPTLHAQRAGSVGRCNLCPSSIQPQVTQPLSALSYAPNSEPEAPHARTRRFLDKCADELGWRPRGVSATTTLGFMRLTLGADLAGMTHSASRARTFHILTKQAE
jgi:hypothetical protein